jgi:hypothetical protein
VGVSNIAIPLNLSSGIYNVQIIAAVVEMASSSPLSVGIVSCGSYLFW